MSRSIQRPTTLALDQVKTFMLLTPSGPNLVLIKKMPTTVNGKATKKLRVVRVLCKQNVI